MATSENITLTNGQSVVRFFFGPEVLVPKDNNVTGNEQCFEIGLLCTIDDTPVVHGDSISYSAYVETDFGIRTSTQSIALIVSGYNYLTARLVGPPNLIIQLVVGLKEVLIQCPPKPNSHLVIYHGCKQQLL